MLLPVLVVNAVAVVAIVAVACCGGDGGDVVVGCHRCCRRRFSVVVDDVCLLQLQQIIG